MCCPSLIRISGKLPIRTAILQWPLRCVLLVRPILHRPTIRRWPPRTPPPLTSATPPESLLLWRNIRIPLLRTPWAPLGTRLPGPVTILSKNRRYLALENRQRPSLLSRSWRPVTSLLLARSGRQAQFRLYNSWTNLPLSLVLSRQSLECIPEGLQAVIIALLPAVVMTPKKDTLNLLRNNTHPPPRVLRLYVT